MYNSCYQTTGGAPFYDASIVANLRRARAENQLQPIIADVPNLLAVTAVNPNTKTIPAFTSPVRVDDSRGADYWVIDLRPYAAKLAANNNVLPDEGPLNLFIKRTLLEIYWNTHGPLSLQKAGDMAVVTYANWVSGLLQQRLKTDPLATGQIRILAGYYHLMQYIPEDAFSKSTKEAYAIKLARLFARNQSDRILDFLESVPYINSLAQFCEVLRSKIDLDAVKLVDPVYMLNLVGTSWFGQIDARELVTISLEFPPALIAIVCTATKERNYKKTLLGEIIKREAMEHKLDQYILSINDLLVKVGKVK